MRGATVPDSHAFDGRLTAARRPDGTWLRAPTPYRRLSDDTPRSRLDGNRFGRRGPNCRDLRNPAARILGDSSFRSAFSGCGITQLLRNNKRSFPEAWYFTNLGLLSPLRLASTRKCPCFSGATPSGGEVLISSNATLKGNSRDEFRKVIADG
jgi:hypothetical protein